MMTTRKRLCLMALICLATLPTTAQQAWWGLWNTGQGLVNRSLLYGGTNNLYVRLTAQNSQLLVGGQLHGVRFYLSDKSAVTSARVWVSSNPSGGDDATLLSQTVGTDALRDMTHDGTPTVVSFDEPVRSFR